RNSLTALPRLDFPALGLGETRQAEARRRPLQLAERVAAQLLAEVEGALAVIDEDNRIVLLQGASDRFLQLPAGELQPQLPNLVDVCREGLRQRVRMAITQVRRQGQAVQQQATLRQAGQSLP